MSWNRKETDPLEARRRQIAEAEQRLLEQRRKLTEQLNGSSEPKSVEPPVWRMEEDTPHRATEPAAARKRDLARQRQRDRILFFIFIVVLLVIIVVAYCIAHSTSPANNA